MAQAIAPKQEMATSRRQPDGSRRREQRYGSSVGDGLMLNDFGKRQSVQVGHVHRHVNDADDRYPKHHGQRYIAARLFHLARHPCDIDPSVVGPEDGNQRHAECGKELTELMPMVSP